MNVLILNWRDPFHPFAGGAEQSLLEHAKYWQKKGLHVAWFASSYSGSCSEENIEGIKIIRKGSHYTVTLWAFFYILHDKSFDVIIDCFHGIPFFTPLYVYRKKIIALIHEVAGRVWFKNLSLPIALIGFILEKISFWIYKRTSFITVSESTKKELIVHGISSKNIYLIHNGVDRVKVNSKKKKNVLMFLGRLSDDKGIQDVLKSFLSISSKYSDIELWLVGKEEKEGYIETILAHKPYKSVRNRIKYFGYVSEEKKHKLLEEATILLHPSVKEGWGLNVIEAATHKTPTIGYDVAGLRDSIIDGKTGVLVKPGYNNLTHAIDTLLSNTTQLDTMSNNAKKWSDQFSWKKAVEESYKLIINS